MAEVFTLTHDAVDLSEYTSTSGVDITATAGAGLCGTAGGMNVLIDDTAEQYGRKDFAAGDEFRTRFYIDPNGVTITAGAMRVLWWKNAAGTTKYQCYLQMSGANYAIRLYAYTDGGSNTTVATGTLTDDGTNYVEVYFKAATGSASNDGIARLWIKGSLIGELTNIDNYDYSDDINQLRVGKSDMGTISGTIFIDEIVCRDDNTEIGPYATAGGAIHRLVSPVRLGMLIRGGLAL